MKRQVLRSLAKARNLLYSSKNRLKKSQSIENNYFYFDSYAGRDFNDSPYQIFKYLYNNYPNNYFIWVFKDKNKINEFKQLYPNCNVIALKYNSLKHYEYLNKAKVWVVNYKTPTYFNKKPDTIYLQTWHGIPLKRLGCDIIDRNQTFYRSQQTYQEMCQSYQKEGMKCDYFIAPSDYACQKLTSAFQLDENKLVKVGYPRNELLYLYKDDHELKATLRQNLNLTKKTILYAPTWRDDSSSIQGYKNHALLDFDDLYQKLKKQYQIIYRPHYLIKETYDFSKYDDFIIDGSKYSNLSELMIASDLLITDYSSLYFDYSILEQPIYFYMPDLDKYQDELRGFYIDINKDLPNDYYTEQNSLIKAIKNNEINTEKWSDFLKQNKNYPLDYRFIDKIIGENNE